MEDDTDVLLTLVQSLLEPASECSQADILEALVQFSGNVEDTAAHLNKQPMTRTATTGTARRVDDRTTTRKRKRSGNLDAWLKPTSKPSTTRENDDPKPIDHLLPKPRGKSAAAPAGSSSSKPVVDLMKVLRPPPSTEKKGKGTLPRLPPLLLSSPALVAQHVPCTLHYSVLPPDLACELFYTMIDASRDWKRNKWWLFDRVVESPHLTSFFARRTNGLDDDETWQEAARYWYNGRMTDPPATFPEPMERACRIVEGIVNEELAKRKRFKLEWGSPGDVSQPEWRANVAASNCYAGSKESVGWHSDQLTYLGPYPTIASLSLGTRRNFSLREVIPTQEAETRRARTFNIPLPHNSLTIMHASCQEAFKHSIPPQNPIDLYHPAYPRSQFSNRDSDLPITDGGAHVKAPSNSTDISDDGGESSNCRINITFRFYRPDFRAETIPKCHCGIPTILRPDMKHRVDSETDRYWWTCYAGAQNDGKGCNFWKVMDMEAEGRGPCIGVEAMSCKAYPQN